MSIRDKLLDLLEKRPSGIFSGATLADDLAVTRTSVWKHMRELRQSGWPIKSTAGNGYQLGRPVDFSLRRPSWPANLATKIHYHYQLSTTSTQTLARSAAEQGAPEGHLWVSEIQTRGRGRLDRSWDSGFGGLWFSLVLRPAIGSAKVPPLSLVAALALAEAIEDVSGISAQLKWPNDVVWAASKTSFRKVAGILTQMSGEIDRTNWVVIGIGVNVHNPLPAPLKKIGARLADGSAHFIKRSDLLIGFLERFWTRYRVFQKQGFAAARENYWSRYGRPEQPVRLKTAQGMIRGIATGVDDSGALIVKSRRKTQTILEGEIIT